MGHHYKWGILLFREGVGPIAVFALYATKLMRRWLTSSPIAATPSAFGEWSRVELASPPFAPMSGRSTSPLRIGGRRC
jgi:hypothetical protein